MSRYRLWEPSYPEYKIPQGFHGRVLGVQEEWVVSGPRVYSWVGSETGTDRPPTRRGRLTVPTELTSSPVPYRKRPRRYPAQTPPRDWTINRDLPDPGSYGHQGSDTLGATVCKGTSQRHTPGNMETSTHMYTHTLTGVRALTHVRTRTNTHSTHEFTRRHRLIIHSHVCVLVHP